MAGVERTLFVGAQFIAPEARWKRALEFCACFATSRKKGWPKDPDEAV